MKMEQVHGELELAKSEIERLKFNVNEKETLVQHLSSANNKLRNDSDSNLRKLEDDKIQLLKALDEAEAANNGKDKAIGVLQSELDNIKAMLSASQKKCSDAEQEAKALKESSLIDDRLGSLEDGRRKLEEQLKWKKEQFELLIQAHEKLKCESEASKREWELEKSSLLDEMSTLQSTLDCQNSKAESLKTQLDRCKQALVHEESRRRNLESQVSDMRTSVSNDCWDAKSSDSTPTATQRDDEVAALRDSMRCKESDLREAEYRAKKLEKENQDLLSSLRELQEAHIPKAPSTPPSTVTKIKSKLRSIEQAHKDCSLNLRSKEADWNSQMQMMRRDIEDSKFSLKMKEASIKELKKEVEECNATNTELKLQNEELSLMLQLLSNEVSENQSSNNHSDEVQKYKEMLDESYRERERLKNEVQELCDAAENLNFELTEKICEGSEIEFELQIWRSAAERLHTQLEENRRLRGELELSLLAQAGFEEELKLEICNLKQQFGIMLKYEEDKWQKQEEEEEETVNKQFLKVVVGKGREIRASDDERSPFREIN